MAEADEAAAVKTFIVHGDEDALAGLQERIRSTLNWTVEVPKPRESVYLT